MEKTYRQPPFGKENSHPQTDLELNLAMMEAMGGAKVYGDKPNTPEYSEEDDFIGKILEQVDRPDSLGPAN